MEPAHGAQANVEIKHLPQGDVDGAGELFGVERDAAMATDGLHTTRPVEYPVGPPEEEAADPTRKACVEEDPQVPAFEAPQAQAPALTRFDLQDTGCSRPSPSSGTSTCTTPLVRP